jgi:hypothetical protein
MITMKKALAILFAAMLVISFSGCETPSPSPTPTASPAPATPAPPTETPTVAPTPTPSPTPTPTPTATPVPSPTAEAPDSAGSGSVLFDIYQSWALVDINKDGTAEDIKFTSGGAKSVLEINGTAYNIAKPNLAQLFAVTDINTSDNILELVFTDNYDAGLADSEKAFSWVYWWNGTKLIYMGGLMDIKFAGAWRSTFVAKDHFNGKGVITCLMRSTNLTDIWYMGHYKPSVDYTDRRLVEYYFITVPINEVGPLTCKTVCLIQKKYEDTYFNSMYDYYWIPTLAPTTLGRILDPDTGIKIIVRPGETLTITGVYGSRWFRVKTFDGYQGWIYCKDKKVGAYNATMGWTADDMFDGLMSAG